MMNDDVDEEMAKALRDLMIYGACLTTVDGKTVPFEDWRGFMDFIEGNLADLNRRNSEQDCDDE